VFTAQIKPNPSAGLFFIKGLFADCNCISKDRGRQRLRPNRNPTFTVYLRTRKPTGGESLIKHQFEKYSHGFYE